ncbi:MAG TPA: hypothetical protein VGG70_12475 [Candidatus Cybelea sp.]
MLVVDIVALRTFIVTLSRANKTREKRARTLAVRPSLFSFLHDVKPASD